MKFQKGRERNERNKEITLSDAQSGLMGMTACSTQNTAASAEPSGIRRPHPSLQDSDVDVLVIGWRSWFKRRGIGFGKRSQRHRC
ncbi:MAG: hypothetical protein ACLSA6_05185 [Holdemania massiliensis]